MLIGYQAVYDADWFDALEYAKNNQFDYVSFDLNVPRFYVDRLSLTEKDRIKSHSEALGVGMAFHAPGDNISLFSDYPSVRKGILEHFAAIISAAEHMNARHVTVHTGSYPSFKQANAPDDDFIAEHRDYFEKVLYENLSYLADQTKSVMLCVENHYFTPLTMVVVERLLGSSDKLFLTWDIAKTYDKHVQPIPGVESFMRKHSHRVREVHVHDIIKGFRSHQMVGDGDIDFRKYAALLKRSYIAVTIEVRPREAAAISRDRLLAMLDE